MFLLARPLVCQDLSEIWEMIGWILWIFKIAIPILIIIFGMIDLGKAVVASKPEEISKSAKSLAFRAVAGILIFFVPYLVNLVFGAVNDFDEIEDDNEYRICVTCVTKPSACQAAAAGCADNQKYDEASDKCVAK